MKEAAYILTIEGTFDTYKHGGKYYLIVSNWATYFSYFISLYESGKLAISACIFTARCTSVAQSAVLRSHVIRLSVRPSLCNVGGSGSHTLEILETNCTDN